MNQRLKNKYKIIIKKEKSKYCNIKKKKKKKLKRMLKTQKKQKQVNLEKVVFFQEQEAEGN